jgi:hypothetical protein
MRQRATRSATLLIVSAMAAFGSGGCGAPAGVQRAALGGEGEDCPCAQGYVCAGDPVYCQKDCTSWGCPSGYYCDWSTLLCAQSYPPNPGPREEDKDCHHTGCPTGYVCLDDNKCEPDGWNPTSGCQGDWECGAGEICRIQGAVGTCVSGDVGSPCTTSQDCDPFLNCGSAGRCVSESGGSCTSSADCDVGLNCSSGYCV